MLLVFIDFIDLRAGLISQTLNAELVCLLYRLSFHEARPSWLATLL